MSIPGSAEPLLLAQQDTGYKVERSLRFNSSDSAYLSRTPASAGNRKTWTWAGWVKRSKFGANMPIFGTDFLGASYCSFYFDTADTFFVEQFAGSMVLRLRTTQVFRDPSAWFHILVSVDTTQATAANRAKIYINGSEVTALSISTYPAQNTDLLISNNQYHEISQSNSTYTFGGYLADIHFIDGQALTPSSFTEVDATTGQLVPKAYSGSFGTNGFWLKFSDNSAATATTLGKDYSGNSNNWTPNNLSVTAGAGNDSLTDTPTSHGTDTGAGSEVRGNYCTINPLDINNSPTIANGNLDITGAASTVYHVGRCTFAVSTGKWYWEATINSAINSVYYPAPGILKSTAARPSQLGGSGTDTGYAYMANGQKYSSATLSAYGASFVQNDVIGFALDMDAGTLVCYKNGVSQGTLVSGLTGSWSPSWNVYSTTSLVYNFGQRPFAYTAPSGFKALCDTNLPAPVVAKPDQFFQTALWSGDGASTRTITVGFEPDLIWEKVRNNAQSHLWYDVVRGFGANKAIGSNSTIAEGSFGDNSGSGYVSGTTSTGFSIVKGTGSAGYMNDSGYTQVAWCWDAGSSTVTNTQGSITSTVRANPSAGFSIVSFFVPSSGTNFTVGHGLGVTPSLIITKGRDSADNWVVFHSAVSTTTALFLRLNTTDSLQSIAGLWGTAMPNSTVFGGRSDNILLPNQNAIAYCFAPVAGYSSFGSYTGNGSTDGPFVFTGMRPRWLLLKAASAGESYPSWRLFDTARDTYNVSGLELYPNLSIAEADSRGSGQAVDILSNGFKLRASNTWNTSGVTYIYCSFAESPFQYARAR